MHRLYFYFDAQLECQLNHMFTYILVGGGERERDSVTIFKMVEIVPYL